MANKVKWWRKEWWTTQEERILTLSMDSQSFLRGRWLPKDKNEQHKNIQMFFLFFIQWPFFYRRMAIFLLTSSKCEWEALVGTSHPFSVIPRRNLGEIIFIPKVDEALPNSSMCHFYIFMGLSTISCALHALCTSYTMLAQAYVCALLGLNVCRFPEPLLHSFMIVLWNWV